MADTYGTRPLSWYSDQAPDELWGEDNGEREEEDDDRQHRETGA
jgi:hypothetical protein